MRRFVVPLLSISLRDMRNAAGLCQRQLAKRSGVGEKTISSFESGQRIDSMKLSQLQKLVSACGVGLRQFLDKFVDDVTPDTEPLPPRVPLSRAEHAHELILALEQIEEDGHDALEVLHLAVGARTAKLRGVA